MSISTFISSYIKYTSRYRIFFLSLAQKGINPKCQLRKFENKRVNGKNVQINTQHDVAMSLFPSRRLCCFGFCMYLFSRFKGSRFQSTLNGKNQKSTSGWEGTRDRMGRKQQQQPRQQWHWQPAMRTENDVVLDVVVDNKQRRVTF